MENQTHELLLDSIQVSTTNEMFRHAKRFTEEALGDLRDSIAQHGVIQPILVRPDHNKAGMFILICGERRYRASMLAGKEVIPAQVKDVTDEIALILQITENINREDVHPLDEAKGYLALLESDSKLTTAELALKFGKSETYILQRLKLNSLVKDAKKDFYNGKMFLGHAIMIARLTTLDQKAIVERYTSRSSYGTVSELSEFVDRQITNILSSAAFSVDDPELYKKAGACTTCPKRSGCSPLLFADVQEQDRCFDRSCFHQKTQRHLINKTNELIETSPEVVFITDQYAREDEGFDKVQELIAGHKLSILRNYQGFNTARNGGTKVKGLWISGNRIGHMDTIYLRDKHEEKKADRDDPKQQVIRIKERVSRGRELDEEKVYAKTLAGLQEHVTQKKVTDTKMCKEEEALLWFIVFDKAGFQLKHELRRSLKLPDEKPEKMYDALGRLKPNEKSFLLRRVMLDQYGGNYPRTTQGIIIRKIAEAYGDIDIRSFEQEQEEIRTRREDRAKQKISDLRRTKVEKGA